MTKRRLAGLAALLCLLLFCACSAEKAPEIGWNGQEVKEIPKELRFQSFWSPEFGEDTESSATAIDDTTGKGRQVDFFHPFKKSIDRLTEHPGWFPNGTLVERLAYRHSYRIRITEIEKYVTTRVRSATDTDWPKTVYHIEVLRDEESGEVIEQDAYLIDTYGAPTYYTWGFARPAVGEEYLLVDADPRLLLNWREYGEDYAYNPAYLFEIQKIDGTEYLYSMESTLDALDFKIEITDEEENRMYKDYKDWDILAALEETGYPCPTFDYKVELDEFVAYRAAYNREWNEKVRAKEEAGNVLTPEMATGAVSNRMQERDLVVLNPREP